MSSAVTHAEEPGLPVSDFRRVLVESGLGAVRPVDDEARLAAMLAGANFILTARREGALVGVARCLTDRSWTCYVAELAVSRQAQGLGVGRGLLDEARRRLGPTVSLVLASVPQAVGFYARAGMLPMPDAFQFRRER